MKYKIIQLPIVIFLFAVASAFAQDEGRAEALKLYREGDNTGAILILERLIKQTPFDKDAEVWNTLGLSYFNSGAPKKARGALEKDVELSPGNSLYRANLAFVYLLRRQLEKSQKEVEKALELEPNSPFANYIVAVRHYWEGELDDSEARLDKILGTSPDYGRAYLLKSEVLMSRLGKRLAVNFKIRDEIDLLRQAVTVLELGKRNSKDATNQRLIGEKLDSLKWFYDFYSGTSDPDGTTGSSQGAASVTPLKILHQPKAVYPDEARNAGAEGAVRLAIHLGANGKVGHILKLWGTGYGLDEAAVRAAQAIRFEPKQVDGKPISVVVIREYTFSIR